MPIGRIAPIVLAPYLCRLAFGLATPGSAITSIPISDKPFRWPPILIGIFPDPTDMW